MTRIWTSVPCLSADAAVKAANPFYAMDTAFQRGGLTTDQQLDLVKELGFDGIAWDREDAEVGRRRRQARGQARPGWLTPRRSSAPSPQMSVPLIVRTEKVRAKTKRTQESSAVVAGLPGFRKEASAAVNAHWP